MRLICLHTGFRSFHLDYARLHLGVQLALYTCCYRFHVGVHMFGIGHYTIRFGFCKVGLCHLFNTDCHALYVGCVGFTLVYVGLQNFAVALYVSCRFYIGSYKFCIQAARNVHTETNFCQIFDQVFDQVFGQVFDQVFDQGFDQVFD